MKWFKQKYEKLPRPLRTAIHLGLLPLLALVIYIVIQTPTFSGTIALRLAEKANMVGPGRVLGIVNNPHYPTTQVIVAEDEEGYIFCRYYTNQPFERPLLTYREKQGDLTLVACPFFLPDEDKRRLPVLLFCDDPKAEYAEVNLSITIPWDGTDKTFRYTLNASRMTDDYFQFHIDEPLRSWSQERSRALDTFSRVSTPWFSGPYSRDSYDIHATVKLYMNSITEYPDGSINVTVPGDLYKTAELTIDSVADDAVARFGNP